MAGVPELGERLNYKHDPSKVGVVIDRLKDTMVNIDSWEFDPETACAIQKQVASISQRYEDDPNVKRYIVEEWYIWVRIEPI